jgi:hemerythrin-like domain-containing protein
MAARSKTKKRPAAKRSAARKTTTAPDALALLKADHAKVTAMFQQYDRLTDRSQAKKLELARTICNELKVHTRIEEEIFYPAVREALPREDDLLDEAKVEHDGAKDLIRQIDGMQPADDLFDAKVTVLGEYVKHHVKEEQNEMFPKVRKTKLDLREIGMRLAFRKEELMQQLAR